MTRPDEALPRALPTSRVRAQRFLELYEEFGADFLSYSEFCDAFGLPYGYFRKLRSRSKDFEARCSRAEARWEKRDTEAPKTRAPANARRRWPKLELWKGIWLERYRETVDRIEACKMVDVTLDEVIAAMDSDAELAAGFDLIEREILARIEDQHRRDALRGRGAAANQVLRAARGGGERPPQRPGDQGETNEVRAAYRELMERLGSTTRGERTEPAFDSAEEPAVDPQHGADVAALSGDSVDELANDDFGEEEFDAGETAETSGSELAAP